KREGRPAFRADATGVSLSGVDVLVVEDDDTRIMLTKALEFSDANVVAVSSVAAPRGSASIWSSPWIRRSCCARCGTWWRRRRAEARAADAHSHQYRPLRTLSIRSTAKMSPRIQLPD